MIKSQTCCSFCQNSKSIDSNKLGKVLKTTPAQKSSILSNIFAVISCALSSIHRPLARHINENLKKTIQTVLDLFIES